ncbi:MAG: endonuclease III [Deltaproteobacteria bacterium]|nr:endonuclease III [Deltaproteobacteria bacterium]
MESPVRAKARAARIAATLADWYPDDVHTALEWRNPLQLLVSTILSAQATDVKVNQVAPALYARFPDAAALAAAPIEDVETLVRETGFFRNKARSIKGCALGLVERHGGEVPRTLDELVELPGVGRKTANVVLWNCFEVPGIVVDTHVIRVSGRLGLTVHAEAERIEIDLMALLPKDEWAPFCNRLTYLGRRVCSARMPRHSECRLLGDCPAGQAQT